MAEVGGGGGDGKKTAEGGAVEGVDGVGEAREEVSDAPVGFAHAHVRHPFSPKPRPGPKLALLLIMFIYT